MPIQVTCPACHARFKVSDKFAGQTGPCPKCKNAIKIPDADEQVVIHAPDEFGPKDSTGKGTLKPIEREEAKITPVGIAVVLGSILITVVVAFVIGRVYSQSSSEISTVILAIGATLLGPPLAYGCYWFLRNPELEPHRGSSLIVRSVICGVIYAILWAVYAFLADYLFEGRVEPVHLAFLVPALAAGGATTALATFDLDFMNGIFHYGVYLAVTIFMRLIMGIPPY